MAGAGTRLLEVLANVAKDQGYDDPKIDVKPISSGGANYTSQLFEITLSYPGKKDLKLFAKVGTLDEKMRSMSNVPIFEIEIMFYTKIISKFRELEIRHNFLEEEKFLLPKYYGGITDYSEELVILEDFTAKGFRPFNRFKCFDWNYASTCIEALAKLQALSVAYQRENPKEYAEKIEHLEFTTSPEAFHAFLSKSIDCAVKVTDAVYRNRVESLLQNVLEQQTFFKFYKPDRKILLCHGDFRPSNIMHRVGEDGKLQVVLVDYQLIKQGNPAADLVNFLMCGSDEEFRRTHLDQYFDYYYKSLSKCLQRLNINPETVYKEKDFRDDVKEMLPLGLIIAAFSLPIITIEESRAPKPEDRIDFDNVNLEISDQFSVRFNAIVRDYVKLGIL